MSKKNKALKQLLRAQMQANISAVAQKKDLVNLNQAMPLSQDSQPKTPAENHPAAPGSQPIIVDKQEAEFTMIRKDVQLSVLLIILIVTALLIIFIIDRTNPFLLNLANQIFKLI